MAWTKTKMAVAAGVGALLAVGTAIVTVKEIEAHRIYPGLAGVWEGTYFAQRVALKIARTNGTYLATFDFIDSGMDIPASNLKPIFYSLKNWSPDYQLLTKTQGACGTTFSLLPSGPAHAFSRRVGGRATPAARKALCAWPTTSLRRTKCLL